MAITSHLLRKSTHSDFQLPLDFDSQLAFLGITCLNSGRQSQTPRSKAGVLILSLITPALSCIAIAFLVCMLIDLCYNIFNLPTADYLIQSGLASTIHFHGKRFAWFVSDVTQKDWSWLLNTMVHGQLFPSAAEVCSLYIHPSFCVNL